MSLLRVATLIALIASALMGVWAVGIQALRILIPEDQFWAYSADMNLVYMGLAAFLYGALVFFFVVLSINQGAQEPQAAYPGYGTQATTSNPFSPASPAPQPVSQPAPQSAPQPVSQPAPQTPPLPAPRVPQPPPVKRLDL